MKLRGYLRANKPHRGLFSRHYYTILSSRFATGKAICQKKQCGKNLCTGPRRKIPVILKKALAFFRKFCYHIVRYFCKRILTSEEV